METSSDAGIAKKASSEPYYPGPVPTKFNDRRIEILHKLINECHPENKVIYDLGASSTNAISNGIKTKKIVKFDIMPDKYPDVICDLSEGIPAPKSTADICIAGEIIEHLYYANDFLGEVRRVLKGHGRLIVTVPNACSIKCRFLMLFGTLGSNLAKGDEQNKYTQVRKGEGHVRDFNKKEITNLLAKNGFMIEKTTTTGIKVRDKIFIPNFLMPDTFGEDIIIRARKA